MIVDEGRFDMALDLRWCCEGEGDDCCGDDCC
jgi:hypothetical protein